MVVCGPHQPARWAPQPAHRAPPPLCAAAAAWPPGKGHAACCQPRWPPGSCSAGLQPCWMHPAPDTVAEGRAAPREEWGVGERRGAASQRRPAPVPPGLAAITGVRGAANSSSPPPYPATFPPSTCISQSGDWWLFYWLLSHPPASQHISTAFEAPCRPAKPSGLASIRLGALCAGPRGRRHLLRTP